VQIVLLPLLTSLFSLFSVTRGSTPSRLNLSKQRRPLAGNKRASTTPKPFVAEVIADGSVYKIPAGRQGGSGLAIALGTCLLKAMQNRGLVLRR
jgi:hypothetical protein